MPVKKDTTFPSIISFKGKLTKQDFDFILGDQEISVLSTVKPSSVPVATWKGINDHILKQRPNMRMTIIDSSVFDRSGDKIFDFSFLKHLPSLRSLRIRRGFKEEVTKLEALAELGSLEELSLEIHSLNSFECLELVPSGLKTLILSETESKKPSLDVLSRFTELERLYVEKHQKGIEVIGDLPKLSDLTLRSVSPKDISFLRNNKRLWSLDIKLGGIQDFSPLEGLAKLKYLELWQVRGLSDLSFVSTLTGLQFLFLQSLKHVTKLPDLSKLKKLRRVELQSMKSLEDFNSLLTAPALTEIAAWDCQQLATKHVEPLFKKTPKLKMAGFGIDYKCDEEIEQLMAKYKVMEWDNRSFKFKK